MEHRQLARSEGPSQGGSYSYFIGFHQDIPGDKGTQRGGEFDRIHIQEVALEVFQILSFITQVDLQGNEEKI